MPSEVCFRNILCLQHHTGYEWYILYRQPYRRKVLRVQWDFWYGYFTSHHMWITEFSSFPRSTYWFTSLRDDKAPSKMFPRFRHTIMNKVAYIFKEIILLICTTLILNWYPKPLGFYDRGLERSLLGNSLHSWLIYHLKPSKYVTTIIMKIITWYYNSVTKQIHTQQNVHININGRICSQFTCIKP